MLQTEARRLRDDGRAPDVKAVVETAGPRPSSGVTDYLPIAEHGIIGDLHRIALVGTDGRIDWYCCPRFDSPSVFGAILDKERGGFYRIAPATDEWVPKQLYFPDTNVLITRFLTDGRRRRGAGLHADRRGAAAHRHRLIRRVLGVRGRDALPRRRRSRGSTTAAMRTRRSSTSGESSSAPRTLSLALETAVPLEFRDDGAYGEFTLLPGETAAFVLEQVPETYVPRFFSEDETREAFEHTVDYWRRWLGAVALPGPLARDAPPLGADAEADDVPADRRDRRRADDEPARSSSAAGGTGTTATRGSATRAFSLYALLLLGFTEEAAAFMDWLTERFRERAAREPGRSRSCTGSTAARDLEEEVLDHLEGYRGSAPVRIGNGAANQLQLDIYGELIDSVYLYNARDAGRRSTTTPG